MRSSAALLAVASLLQLGGVAAVDVTALHNSLTAGGVSALFPTDALFLSLTVAPVNRRYSVAPVAVAFPTSPQQVAAAVQAGTAQGMPVVARSGGHSYIANGLGGSSGALVVDLSKMKSISVRSGNNTALIQTGNRLGDVALALNAAGRALPHGTCSYVGIGGHSGYGGFGFTSRQWGLTLDTIKSATVVLANGTIASASSSVNPDLFWAIRGASPSMGIVTSIEVQTFAAPASTTVFQYQWNSLDVAAASKMISALQTFAATNISPQLGIELVFAAGPSSGRVFVGVTGAWYGAASSFNSTIAPYLAIVTKPSSSTITPGSYIASVATLSAPDALNTTLKPDGHDTFYTKSLMTPSGSPMSSAAISAFVSYMAVQGFSSDTSWFVQVELYGGSNSAINAVALDSTAFSKRDTLFTIQMYASSSNLEPPYPSDGFSFLDGMANSIVANSPSGWAYGAYLNYADDRLANGNALYYGSHYARLQSIKASLDPVNTFRFPVGVTSTTTTPTGKTIRPNKSSTTCLAAASNADGAAVVVQPCTSGATNQQWTQNGATLLVFGNKCLDVTDSNTANGAKLQIWTCTPGQGGTAQRWTITSDKTIQWSGKAKCVDLTNGSTASGSVQQTWDCSSTVGAPFSNQVWNWV
ncbi:Glucooligosaccharide oxidase [Mycena kentingensis (nom. inval.)]|nr:Glucooligosaccharide oxidase [Mycena kentingensis (nom. inval.)]